MTMSNKKVFVVGVSGVTCSGKTTIAMELNKFLPDSKVFCQDDYFFDVNDPRHVWIPDLNHINFDILSSLDMEGMTRDIVKHTEKEAIKKKKLPKSNGILYVQNKNAQNLLKNIQDSEYHIVIVEGFCIFNYRVLADLCDLKYYFTLDYDECFKRRMKRVYEPPDCPGYFEKCAWPEHLKQIAEVRENVKDVVYFDRDSTDHTEKILSDIAKALNLH